ncbi:MAG TPA: sensor domain-containing diguanylate cyclase [Burkholderiaceae bacterium]
MIARTDAVPRPDAQARQPAVLAVAALSLAVLFGIVLASLWEPRARDAGGFGFAALLSALVGLSTAFGAFTVLLLRRGTRLRRSMSHLHAIADSLPELVCYVDRDRRVRFANRAFAAWLGTDPARLAGRLLGEVCAPAMLQRITPHLDAAMNGETEIAEHDFPGVDGGEAKRMQVTALADRLSARVVGFTLLISDLTARRHVEHALRESEQRLRLVADMLPMRISYIDAGLRYRFNNLAYERAFGVKREALYGRSIREVLGEATWRDIEPWIRRVLAGETVTYQSEMTVNDQYQCFEATYIPEFADDGVMVRGFQAVVQDITPIKLQERRLLRIALLDPVTGRTNRAGFDLRLFEAMQRSQAEGALMALLYMDLDRFKQVNDTRGHAAGDALLRAFADRVAQTLRASDLVARVGGDEFGVVLERLPGPEHATTVADKIVRSMQQPFACDAQACQMTTSIGIAFYDGGGIAPAALVERADDLMYRSKEAGRNTWKADTEFLERRARTAF